MVELLKEKMVELQNHRKVWTEKDRNVCMKIRRKRNCVAGKTYSRHQIIEEAANPPDIYICFRYINRSILSDRKQRNLLRTTERIPLLCAKKYRTAPHCSHTTESVVCEKCGAYLALKTVPVTGRKSWGAADGIGRMQRNDQLFIICWNLPVSRDDDACLNGRDSRTGRDRCSL